ncbi:MAG: arylsulfatase [Elusimicrobia bacterium]|nr:arylsulfatase [Elusimicrobiota bacterium]
MSEATGRGGRIGPTVPESEPWWPRPARATGPNVVMIVLDDVGFAQLGCYGAAIRTPRIDRLAAGGLRYTNFHVAALCSPTRASLLTGRNHHAVGMGFLAAFDTGFPGYRGAISPAAATVAEILRDTGYGTLAVGKWHLTPPGQMSPAGPFRQWPTQRGFDRYYGFLWGEDDQWAPEIWYDQHRVDVGGVPGYHLSEDLVGRSKELLADHITARPDDPFFLYLALGAGHAPHQAPRSYIDRYRGAFDHGWDTERERILARQIAMGVVPQGTTLTPRNPGVVPWDVVPSEQQRLYARMQEVFAGFMEHADEQIGDLVDFLDRYGRLDDTLILVLSDNGASGEGGPHGSANEYRYFLGLGDPLQDALAAYDDLGGPLTHGHYPMGWAQAGNTPLRYYKKHTYGGGVRAPLVIHWPGGVDRSVPLRGQFHHAIDVVPTLLEVAGVSAPETHAGIPQLPMHGLSMAYTFRDATATSTRRLQYFETAGYRGIYRDGWKAVAEHEPGRPFEIDRWSLYHLDEDFSESRDLSDRHPELAAELERAWWEEASRYEVLPLDDRMQARAKGQDPALDRRRYELLPGARLLNAVVGPRFAERPFTVSATVDRSSTERGDGVLLAYGRRAAGFSLYIQEGRLCFDYNLAGDHTVVRSRDVVPPGRRQLELRVNGGARPAQATLVVDGIAVAESWLPRLLPGGLGTMSLQCGHNAPSAVSLDYEPPFTFQGSIDRVVVTLGDPLRDAMRSDDDGEISRQ